MLKIFVKILLCLIIFGLATNAQESANKKTEPPPDSKKINQRPVVAAASEPFDKADVKTMAVQCVKLETGAGSIEMEMFPETAPETVRNFLNLAAIGAFDTTVFSRVVPDFIIQGGNLATRENITSELAKRARQTISDEPNAVKHERGIVSMARSDEPNSATTHFFILVSDAPSLDGKFAAFGRVTGGMEIVEAINKMPVDGDKPLKPVRISHAIVAPCAVRTEK
ncbi:MAG: peptidylprolyl isomerase [Pyrinomonadaceae bacterium]